MQSSQYTAESFWQLYLSLPADTKKDILKKFVLESDLNEDILDEQTFDERRDEPSVSIEGYLKKRAGRVSA